MFCNGRQIIIGNHGLLPSGGGEAKRWARRREFSWSQKICAREEEKRKPGFWSCTCPSHVSGTAPLLPDTPSSLQSDGHPGLGTLMQWDWVETQRALSTGVKALCSASAPEAHWLSPYTLKFSGLSPFTRSEAHNYSVWLTIYWACTVVGASPCATHWDYTKKSNLTLCLKSPLNQVFLRNTWTRNMRILHRSSWDVKCVHGNLRWDSTGRPVTR